MYDDMPLSSLQAQAANLRKQLKAIEAEIARRTQASRTV